MSTVAEKPLPADDVERVVLAGLDFVARCHLPDVGEHRAEVVLTCRRCGSARLLCHAHLEWMRDYFAAQPRRIRVVKCTVCQYSAADWDQIAEVVPL